MKGIKGQALNSMIIFMPAYCIVRSMAYITGYFFVAFRTFYLNKYLPSNIVMVPPINAPKKQPEVAINSVTGILYRA